jgi:hypothetical protein
MSLRSMSYCVPDDPSSFLPLSSTRRMSNEAKLSLPPSGMAPCNVVTRSYDDAATHDTNKDVENLLGSRNYLPMTMSHSQTRRTRPHLLSAWGPMVEDCPRSPQVLAWQLPLFPSSYAANSTSAGVHKRKHSREDITEQQDYLQQHPNHHVLRQHLPE